ncbi:MAG TPA: serine/threonine-protein kinase [Kofleriaceae bacterium]
MPIDGDPDDEAIASNPTIARSGNTLGPQPTIADTAHGHAGPSEPREAPSLPGYVIAGLIGRGGMGEVVRGHDVEIGRDVAIKRLRGTRSPDAIARFLREAKIQARLEHPAIIPVHTIGSDSEGQPYFTMKRITGVTLVELLKTEQPHHRLLRAFVDVCRAMDFAHGRNVVHRDIKPSNVMLGDYGEVYVLDWGLARVLGAGETETEVDIASVGDGVPSVDGSTQVGAMLGTPGYMAPEQMEDAHAVDAAADVYALGSILFEILAGQALHRKGQILTSTLGGTDTSPATRRPDLNIAPELDALCTAALDREPSRRPSAREIGDRVEGFLDGDRDVEARRRIVALELAEARDALASGDPTRRSEAMQSAGRALALDPKSRDAADLVTTLMLEPPKEQPAGLREQLAASEVAVQRRQGRVAVGSFGAILAFLALAAWNGIEDWSILAVITAFSLLLASVAFIVSRREMSSREILFLMLGNVTLVALISRMFGSLLIAPAVTCIMALSLTSYPQNIDRARLVIAVLVLSWVIPVALEFAGVIESTWYVTDGAVISTSPMVTIGGDATVGLLVFANVMTIIVFGLFASKLAVSRRDAQRQVEIQAWHLQQLLPKTG